MEHGFVLRSIKGKDFARPGGSFVLPSRLTGGVGMVIWARNLVSRQGHSYSSLPDALVIDKFINISRNKKYRETKNSFVVPGLVGLQECPPASIRHILACSGDVLAKLQKTSSVLDRVPTSIISASQYYSIVRENNPHGIVALVDKFDIEPLPTLVGTKRYLGINGIRDGANLGLLIRAAGCLGWNGVVLIGTGNVDPFGLQTVRSSAGTIFKVPLFKVAKFEDVEVQIILAEVPDKAIDKDCDIDYSKPLLLVIGNERLGHAHNVPGNCKYISIPIAPGFGSLNAALAGAILMSKISQ